MRGRMARGRRTMNACQLPPGTRLRDFEIVSVLGGGRTSFVYQAYDSVFERRVTLKEYLPAAYAVRDERLRCTRRAIVIAASRPISQEAGAQIRLRAPEWRKEFVQYHSAMTPRRCSSALSQHSRQKSLSGRARFVLRDGATSPAAALLAASASFLSIASTCNVSTVAASMPILPSYHPMFCPTEISTAPHDVSQPSQDCPLSPPGFRDFARNDKPRILLIIWMKRQRRPMASKMPVSWRWRLRPVMNVMSPITNPMAAIHVFRSQAATEVNRAPKYETPCSWFGVSIIRRFSKISGRWLTSSRSGRRIRSMLAFLQA
jgi:hypothetical protein